MTRFAWHPAKESDRCITIPTISISFTRTTNLSVKQISPLIYHPLTGDCGRWLFMLSTYPVSRVSTQVVFFLLFLVIHPFLCEAIRFA